MQYATHQGKWYGLSTDVKPTDVQQYTKFFEIDTNREFIFNGASWVSHSQPTTLVGSLASPLASSTRPNDNISYTAGDVCANFTFTDILDQAGQKFIVDAITLLIAVGAIPSGMTTFTLHIYNAVPAVLADNAPWVLADADRGTYLGSVDVNTALSDIKDLGNTLWIQRFNDGVLLRGKGATGSKTLYGQLVTNGAFTPTALVVKTAGLQLLGV